MLPPGSNEPIHITFDNSDGRLPTITAGQTTHHTTDTIFQIASDNNNNTEYPEKGDILDADEQILENSKFPRKEHHHQEFQIFMRNLLMLNDSIFHLQVILLGYY